MKTIAFVNNRGGAAKAFFVYHLAHMYADQQTNVLVADLDPQANLTGMFIVEQRLEKLWGSRGLRTVHPWPRNGGLHPLGEPHTLIRQAYHCYHPRSEGMRAITVSSEMD